MNTTIKTLLATSVALTMGAASANIFNTPAFPTVEAGSHTADTMGYFDAATVDFDLDFEDYSLMATVSNGVTATRTADGIDFTVGGVTATITGSTNADLAGKINAEVGYHVVDASDLNNLDVGDNVTVNLDIESTNEWYKHGSGSSDLGDGYSFSLGYGQTDISAGLNVTGTKGGQAFSESLDTADFGYSDQITNVTVGVNKVVWSDSDEAIVVGANYGTESNLSVGTSYQKNIMVGKGMIQAGVSAGHNVDSGITGFGYMAGYDAGVQAVGFDGIYGGFSLTDGLMTVGIVDVDTDGTRHNLTLNPIGILINLLMGNDTVLNHNFNK